MQKHPPELSISQKMEAGGFLSIDEFSQWAGIGRVKTYGEIKAGRLCLTKIGKRSFITAPDALAYRDGRRSDSMEPRQ